MTRFEYLSPILHAALLTASEERGITWEQVAQALGCTTHDIDILADDAKPSHDLAMDIASFTGHPISDFLLDVDAASAWAVDPARVDLASAQERPIDRQQHPGDTRL